jgi:hypothetical protein
MRTITSDTQQMPRDHLFFWNSNCVITSLFLVPFFANFSSLRK